MSVRKRKLPSGAIRWQFSYKDVKGERRGKMFETKREATAYETTVRGELKAGVHVPDSASISVADACELWLGKCENEEGLEPSTLRQYRGHVANHIVPSAIGNLRLSRLSTPIVEAFRDDLLKSHSKALTRKVITSLKSILKESQRRGLTITNAASATQVRQAGRHKTKTIIPSKAEIRAMLTKSAELWPATKPWRTFIVLAIFSGLRLSELRGLTWDNIDLSGGLLKVRQRADYRGIMGNPKSQAGARDIVLAPMAANALRQWKLACPRTDGDLVFPNSRTGKPLSTEGVHDQAWRPLLRALNLIDVDADGRSL